MNKKIALGPSKLLSIGNKVKDNKQDMKLDSNRSNSRENSVGKRRKEDSAVASSAFKKKPPTKKQKDNDEDNYSDNYESEGFEEFEEKDEISFKPKMDF